MKKLLFTLLLALSATTLTAQTWKKATPARQAQLMKAIATAARSVKQMGASFVQTTEVSYMEEAVRTEGKMVYNNRGSLKWEYLKPYRYGFELNDKNVTLQTDGTTKTIDLSSSKSFRLIAGLVKGSITGQSLGGSRDFKAVMYENGTTWRADLMPIRPQLKRFIRSVTLYFDRKRKVVDKVVMTQSNEDRITVVLRDIKITR